MGKNESKYGFREHLSNFHREKLHTFSAQADAVDRFAVNENTRISFQRDSSPLTWRAAKSLQEYLSMMNVNVALEQFDDIEMLQQNRIVLTLHAVDRQMRTLLNGNSPRGFRVDCDKDSVVVTGYDDAGILQGIFYLEECMDMNRGPYLKRGTTSRAPLFSPRMVHSGYGYGMYPDAYLCSVVRAGFDAIIITVKGVDQTSTGYMDFNALCRRAAQWGLDVYAYSHLPNKLHPNAPDAQAYYDKIYGSVFSACPAFKGIIFVGEVIEFPSMDERSTGRSLYEPSVDGLPENRPSPGYYPCRDYPDFLRVIKNAIRPYRLDVDIVFWTYNWQYIEAEERIALINNLPGDISLLVTLELHEKTRRGGAEESCCDYTLMFEGAGSAFISEARAAARRDIRLYAMTNTAGKTWDIGVIPYEPVPRQWMKRYDAVLQAREKYGLCGLMESHDYGFFPSIISQLTKAAFTRGTESVQEALNRIINSEFGEGAQTAIDALEYFSDGMDHYICTDADQYGPFRIGPAYPFVLFRNIRMSVSPQAIMASFPLNYHPAIPWRVAVLPFSTRIQFHVQELEAMRDFFDKGADLIQNRADVLSRDVVAHENLLALMHLGRFIARCAQTTAHIKQWWMQKTSLLAAQSMQETELAVAALREIGYREIENAYATIELVRADSILGWGAPMEYICDEAHVRWKITQVQSVLDHELPIFLGEPDGCYPYSFLI